MQPLLMCEVLRSSDIVCFLDKELLIAFMVIDDVIIVNLYGT